MLVRPGHCHHHPPPTKVLAGLADPPTPDLTIPMRAAAPPAATPAAPGVAHIFQCLDFIHVINEAGKRPVPGWEKGCSRPARGRGSQGPGQLPGSPPSLGGDLGARSTGTGVSDAPGSLQACTGWSSPWRPCWRREEAESLGAAPGGRRGPEGAACRELGCSRPA